MPLFRNLNGARLVIAIALLILAVGAVFVLISHSGRAPTRSVNVRPGAGRPPAVQRSYALTTAKIAHWAVVVKPTRAFVRPSSSARLLTTLPRMTSDGTQNIVLVLRAVVDGSRQTWYEVRLAILPNNSIGWVARSALGRLYSVTTHLYVDLEKTTATLERRGVAVFSTTIGIGRADSPTPRGEFYVRDKLNGFHDPFYGPVAFGTSARSAVLTDWPNGGFIGVHGTDRPGVLPGRVSHGCIRMRNAAILALDRLMPVGTPVTIS